MKRENISKILFDAESIKITKNISDETKIKILEESLKNKKKEIEQVFDKIKKESDLK